MDLRFKRLELAIGKKNVDILSSKHIAIFGLGGVGGFVAETLARSSIGKFTLVDFDVVDITNINRQIIATNDTVEKYKTDLFEKRIKSINENVSIKKITKKYTPDNFEIFFEDDYYYIVDAIDIVTSKIHLIKTAYEKNIKIISSMGMGNKLDPSKISITTLDKTSVCKLANVMRKELKKYNITNLKSAFSTEISYITEKIMDGSKMINGSTAFVPSVAGIMIASEIVREFINIEN